VSINRHGVINVSDGTTCGFTAPDIATPPTPAITATAAPTAAQRDRYRPEVRRRFWETPARVIPCGSPSPK